MARAATTRKRSNVVRVNFSGVETSSVVPEGEYIAEVKNVTLEQSDKGNDYLAWELSIVDGKYAKKKLFNNTSLQEQSLWATKRFLECLGVEVPDGEMDLDLEEYKGLMIGVVVEHDVYKGRTQSRVTDTFPVEEGDEGTEDTDEAEERPARVKATKSKEEAPEIDVPTREEVGEMGKAALKQLVADHDLDVELTGATSAQRRAVIKAMDAAGLWDEEPEESEKEEAAPTKDATSSKARAAKKVTYVSDEVGEMDEDELTELVEKHELDVDLDKQATLRRKRAAVIDALYDAGLLQDEVA